MSGESESIYILLAASDLAAAKSLGEYRAASLADEGFIHASPWNQLNRVANKYYGHAVELRVIEIDPARVARRDTLGAGLGQLVSAHLRAVEHGRGCANRRRSS